MPPPNIKPPHPPIVNTPDIVVCCNTAVLEKFDSRTYLPLDGLRLPQLALAP